MLRGLLGFGKEDRPQPPKGKIEVVCPTCGAVQYEPRIVLSTFCKKCGDHLRIEKKRVIGTGVRKYAPQEPEIPKGGSTISTAEKTEVKNSGPTATPPAAPAPSSAREAVKPSRVAPHHRKSFKEGILGAIIGATATAEASKASAPTSAGAPGAVLPDTFDPDDTGFGTMIQRATAASSATATADASAETAPAAPPPKVEQFNQPTEADMALRPHSSAPPPTPSPPPATASTLQKMKDHGFYRQQYFKDAQCFDCGHSFKVGRSARSANCPQCGSWISMEDVEINMNSTHAIKTRGDVIIRKRGHLSTASVQCKDFQCQGLLEANVTATGDASFKTSGTVIGEVRCHRLVIEKGSDVTFVNPIYADQVEIHAKITGTVFSRGQVLITTYGAVNGDVTARSVSIEPGGELNGAMNIIRGDGFPFDPKAKPQ